MGKRIVLVGEEEAAFLMEAIETWHSLNRGNLSDDAYAKRGRRFDLKRHLEGKYTKAEIEEIAEISLALFE